MRFRRARAAGAARRAAIAGCAVLTCGAVLAGSALVSGCARVAAYPIVATPPRSLVTACTTARHRGGTEIGVMARGFPPDTADLTRFENATGVQPGLVSYYPVFGGPFDANAACYVATRGAIPLIQLDPDTTPLAAIADGKYDSYLRGYADDVKDFRARVILGFGHEMNGLWYRWGWQHVPASVFVAAWRHIVEVFRAQGADNVIWLWTINAIGTSRAAPPRPWWPGAAYVTWVGIDAYYRQPTQTFSSLIGPTVAAVHRFTHDPILLAETGVSPQAGKAAKIPDLFAGVRAYGLLGFVWFDAVKTRDWRLETYPAAVAAFRRAARRLGQLAAAAR
jgi:mannan endo-1,4-beta-mannosidase